MTRLGDMLRLGQRISHGQGGTRLVFTQVMVQYALGLSRALR